MTPASTEDQIPIFTQPEATDVPSPHQHPETALLLHWIHWVEDFFVEIADEEFFDDDYARRLYSWWRTRTHAELKKAGICACDASCFNRAGYFGEQEQAMLLDRTFSGFLRGMASTIRLISMGHLNDPVGYPDLLSQYRFVRECLAVDAVVGVLCLQFSNVRRGL